MNYCSIKKVDIANGPGVRVSLFVSGCRNHCPGCFQPETWDFDYGQKFTNDTFKALQEALSKPHIQGVTILGGDPMEPENIDTVEKICFATKLMHKNVWVYSGYTLEQLWQRYTERDFWHNIDVLVDGRFIEELKDLSLQFRGSRNQRLINLPETFRTGDIVLWEDNNV